MKPERKYNSAILNICPPGGMPLAPTACANSAGRLLLRKSTMWYGLARSIRAKRGKARQSMVWPGTARPGMAR